MTTAITSTLVSGSDLNPWFLTDDVRVKLHSENGILVTGALTAL